MLLIESVIGTRYRSDLTTASGLIVAAEEIAQFRHSADCCEIATSCDSITPRDTSNRVTECQKP
jgi:hypothetical protein